MNFSSSHLFQPQMDSVIRHHAIHILEMVLPLLIKPDEGLLTLIEGYLMKLILSQGMLVCALSKDSSFLGCLSYRFHFVFSPRYKRCFGNKVLVEDQKRYLELFLLQLNYSASDDSLYYC